MKGESPTEQTSLFQYNNKNLFSNYYLDNYIDRFSEWKEEERLKPIFEKIKQIYFKNKSYLSSYNEAQLEEEFIKPILKLLGHFFVVQEATHRIAKRPDYAFFADEEGRKEALRNKGKEDFYKKAISVGDAKAWAVPLDRKFRGKQAYTFENPSLQIDIYLRETPPEWGILTNGKFWRIYYEKTSHKLDSYYEVDLQNIVLKDDLEGFKYFYMFFRKEAFILDSTGKTFLDHVYEGSVEYARELGEELKENIYEALNLMAQGFLNWKKNNLEATPEILETIRQNSLIFLYRLLFIFYAESRELLPKEHDYSLDSFKKIIAERERKGEIFPTYTNNYWRSLEEFFDLINEGSEARGIPKKELYIPAYNGGLFDPKIHQFLRNNSIGDYYCAKVIDLLSRAKTKDGGPAFVDYSTLEIRHLGSIYEGLLENELKIALQDLIAIKEKQREIWVPTSELKGSNQPKKGERVVYKNKKYKISDIAHEGTVYLVNDKGERKATGSYYTPDYIVEYIVKNAIGPIIDEKKKAKRDLINEILNIKVLDPAMGSGHFLVEATDFLARALVEALVEKGKQLEEDEIRWARREVIERCLFGVDLNPLAVELAKLSLWLSTVSTNKALSFLDHHLKCGNSLIGAKIDELGQLPDLKKSKKKKAKTMGLFEPEFMKRVGDFLKVFEKIETMPSDTAEQVKEKTRIYNEEFEKKSIPFKTIANLWLCNYFGNEVPFSEYSELQMALTNGKSEIWEKYSNEQWFKTALRIAGEKHFFHWELEFPEIFFEKGKKKENPGFDVVIGNPPYINAIELKRILSPYEKPFWKNRFVVAYGAYDIYLLFFELGLRFVVRGGIVGFITPNKFLSAPYAVSFREFIVSQHQLVNLCDWSRAKVFEDPSVYPVVTLFKRLDKAPKEYQIRVFIANPDGSLLPTERIHRSSNISELPEFLWGFLLSSNFDLVSKTSSISNLLNKVAKVQATSTAAESDEFTGIIQNRQSSGTSKLINTGLIDRYSNLWGLEPLSHKGRRYSNPYLKITSDLVSESRRKLYKSEKIIFAKIALCIEGCFDTKGEFASINTNCIFESDYDLSYICGLMNSKLMSFIYKEYFGALRMSGGYFQFQAPQLEILPVRRISFVTPYGKRKILAEEALKHYKKYLTSDNVEAIFKFIESRLKKQHHPDNELVEEHNNLPLNKDWKISNKTLWEQSDVIHDTLAFLSKKMVELNKEMNCETEEFLKWLETQIKVKDDSKGNKGIEALTGRSQIKDYSGGYQKGKTQLHFQDFWRLIEKNKSRINVNLKSRELFDAIRNEYEKSLSKLLPIKEKILKTDWLINQIVYKLYGLTDEEIKIVEDFVSG
ncbi:MAG: hypothetical protein E3J56_08130 [Candidatus Aminicenantes bacterium]|nr:MAG: hypothetical protein E3J56_08130 [Candidatus Aminicenantes bacterium]